MSESVFLINDDFINNNSIRHAYFTKNIENSFHSYVKKNSILSNNDDNIKISREIAISHFDESAKEFYTLKQVHSNKAIIMDGPWLLNQEPEADGLVTNKKKIILAVTTADCVPILFADAENQVIAAAHAGWKGALSGIIKNTIDKMLELGAQTSSISASIGPCIHQSSYEVGPEFYEKFLNEDSNNAKYFISSKRENHFMFDLPGYVTNKLELAGIKNISNINHNTFEEKELFFSFRRTTLTNDSYGSNLSLIMMK